MKKLEKKQAISLALTGLSVIGVITTSLLAINGTTKAIEILEKEPEIDKKKKFKVMARCYIPMVASGATTIGCIVSNGVINYNTQKSLAAAYVALGRQFSNYRNTVIEIDGEGRDADYIDSMCIRHDSYHVTDVMQPDKIFNFYEPITDQFFEAYEREIMDAEYHINRLYLMRGYVTLSEYLEFLGCPMAPVKNVGWSIDSGVEWMDFDHEHIKGANEKDYVMINCICSPDEDFLEGWC